MSHLPPAGVVQLSPGEDQRLPVAGGREAAAGGGHGPRPGSTRRKNRVEGLTGGALCPGCPHPEGWPSRSLLNPALSHPAAPGCLPVTQSSRISPESPSSPSPGDAAPWAPLWSPDSLGAPQAWPLMVRLRAFGLYGGGGLTF